MSSSTSRVKRWDYWAALPLLVLGGLLAVGGIILSAAGGSFYYLIAGLCIVGCGVLLWRGLSFGFHAFAVVLLGTTIWAFCEVGLDWWQLLPRVDVWFALGVWLVVAFYKMPPNMLRGPSHGGQALIIALVITLIAGLISLPFEPTNINGTLPRGLTDVINSPTQPLFETGKNDWPGYGGSSFGDNYASAKQITPENASKLQVAWVYHTKDLKTDRDPVEFTNEQTPIKIGNTLYLCTPHSIAIAVDATTGKEKWRFDPHLKPSKDGFREWAHMTCRGVAYYDAQRYEEVGKNGPVEQAVQMSSCPRRIFLPTAGAEIIALNADTGTPCEEFGDHGRLNLLTDNLGGKSLPGGYYPTSPPIVTANVLIVGSHVTDNASTTEPSGVVRAFDIADGHLVWNWDSGNPDDTSPLGPGQHYIENSPNVWGLMTADERLGMVYLPMGNQTPDEWGGGRTPGAEKYSAGVVALDIDTGKVRWNKQFTHHDLWDRDQGSQPALIDLKTSQGIKQALVTATKEGSIYVLDRATGEPLIPIHELPVPQSTVPGEHTSPTQPVSDLNFEVPYATEESMWGVSPFDQLYCRIRYRHLLYKGRYTPPTLDKEILVSPGNAGVFDWGGVGIDQKRQLLIVNPNSLAFVFKLLTAEQARALPPAASEGNGIQPNLGAPYAVEITAFLTPWGLPCQAPPYGWMAGVDLTTGKVIWKHKNGTTRNTAPFGIPLPLGLPSQGGVLTTGGGVAFMGAAMDDYLRGFDVRDGHKVFEAYLPAGGQAAPLSYIGADGRQYVVIMSGGHGSLGSKLGDSLMAYALPASEVHAAQSTQSHDKSK